MKDSLETISILGCGWLGKSLGKHLSNKGFKVKGSTTTGSNLESIKMSSIQPYLCDLNNLEATDSDFFSCDLIIISIPPNRKNTGLFLSQLLHLRKYLVEKDVKNVILISSTGIYPNQDTEMTEHDHDESTLLYKVETVFKTSEINLLVLRLAGLMGGERHPGKFLAGRKEVKQPGGKINFIHRDDVIAICQKLIEKSRFNEVFNLCAPEHPNRKEFYTFASNLLHLEPPQFDTNDLSEGKVISSNKLIAELNYTFIHPNPLKAL